MTGCSFHELENTDVLCQDVINLKVSCGEQVVFIFFIYLVQYHMFSIHLSVKTLCQNGRILINALLSLFLISEASGGRVLHDSYLVIPEE